MVTQSSPTPAVNDRVLVIRRTFDAPPALVFQAWTDPALFARWIGPRGFEGRHITQDLRAGGAWRACIHPTGEPQGCGSDQRDDLWMSGTYREIQPHHRLAFTFAWDKEGERGFETLITITFEPAGKTKTLMIFQQATFDSVEETLGHQRGWESSFDRLAEDVSQRTFQPGAARDFPEPA